MADGDAISTDAISATQKIVGDVLGGLLAGEEWRRLEIEQGHVPTRHDFGFGLHNAGPRPISPWSPSS